MQATSLKKYRKLHDMDDLPPGASKEDMIPAVAKHFSQQVIVDFWPPLISASLSLSISADSLNRFQTGSR